MEGTSFEVKGLARLTNALLTSAKGPEILNTAQIIKVSVSFLIGSNNNLRWYELTSSEQRSGMDSNVNNTK